MTREEAEGHALHICRTMGVDDETALLGGLPAYLMGIAEEAAKAATLKTATSVPSWSTHLSDADLIELIGM